MELRKFKYDMIWNKKLGRLHKITYFVRIFFNFVMGFWVGFGLPLKGFIGSRLLHVCRSRIVILEF